MLRDPGRLAFSTWRGHNSFLDKKDTDAQTWYDSLNVIVNAKGHAEVLRSPKAFSGTINPFVEPGESSSDSSGSSSDSSGSSSDSHEGTLHGLTPFRRAAGHVLIIDKDDDTFYVTSAGGAPVGLRSGQAGDPWTSLTINDRFQRIDGNEFIQVMPNLTSIYRNGIDAPAEAPTVSYLDDIDSSSSDSFSYDSSSDSSSHPDITVANLIATGITVSYAYMNTTTGHVGPPSPPASLGASEDFGILRIGVVASTQPGVDKIVLFISVDGGGTPYLLVDCDGDPILNNNATGNIDIDLEDGIERDTLTPETLYNDPPPTDATFMFTWKDRIILLRGRQVQYSGFESTYMGNNYESWPALNTINIPNREDIGVGGISTSAGALIMGQKDSYLISGYPTDKTSSPNNPVAVTEHAEPRNWNIGTRYPETIKNTPYGVIWVDQNKRIRNWNLTGFPIEIGMALRSELDAMGSTIKADWYQHGKDGGYYVLTDGTTMLFLMLYLSPETGQLQFGYGKSNIEAKAVASCIFTTERFFFADDDKVYELLDPDEEGDGWPANTSIFFKSMIGNDGNYSYFHSLRLDGNLSGLTVRVGAPDDLLASELEFETPLEADDDHYALVDQERRRHMVHFIFNADDSERRTVEGFQAFIKNKRRTI